MSPIIYNGDCLDVLSALERVPMIFADPPDNLGLEYAGYKDKKKDDDYYNWIELVVRKALRVCDIFWLSYYWSHDLEIKSRVRNFLKLERPSVSVKTFIWRYTFGQYNDKDCGSGFRFLLRLSKPNAVLYPDNIRVISRRMELGDSRASGPKVPDDVWEFPRVVGNSPERRSWHPTQHPEDLMRRIINFSTKPGDTFVDLFGGTGTSIRAAFQRRPVICEISKQYCEKLKEEHPSAILTTDFTNQMMTSC